MKQHGKIASFITEDKGLYLLQKVDGETIRAFICECYSFGIAEFYECIDRLGKVDAILINSAWCGYTTDAKRQSRSDGVGLFKIGDFMSALHKKDWRSYLTGTEMEHFLAKGWL